jgi:NADH dehydrogenase [ubiquinone] 1 alpha subcomplex assembly factor 5
MNVFDRGQSCNTARTQPMQLQSAARDLTQCCPSLLLAAMKLTQRRRAALAPNFAFYHYLRDEVASRLVDRLADINKAFPTVVELGCGTGAHVSKLLQPLSSPSPAALAALEEANRAAQEKLSKGGSSAALPASVKDRGVIKTLHLCDSSPEALARTREYWSAHASSIPSGRTQEYHLVDEEGALPFEPGSVDLIVSNMSMHWINDLPGFLKRCRTILKPDGVFLAAMLGGSTLQELRSAFTVADIERLGGVQAHVSPFAYGRDCGDLMAAAGFSMPTSE